LLQVAAQAWHIASNSTGEGCINPSVQPYNTMLVSVSSLPKDGVEPLMQCVLRNTTLMSGTCCALVKSEMTFTPQGRYDSMKLTTFVASQIDSGILTTGTSYFTEYAGSFLSPTTADTVDISSSRNDTENQENMNTSTIESSPATISRGIAIGIVVGALVIVSSVVLFLVKRMKNKYKNDRNRFDVTLKKSNSSKDVNDSALNSGEKLLSNHEQRQQPTTVHTDDAKTALFANGNEHQLEEQQ
jgi:hypothetical protein